MRRGLCLAILCTAALLCVVGGASSTGLEGNANSRSARKLLSSFNSYAVAFPPSTRALKVWIGRALFGDSDDDGYEYENGDDDDDKDDNGEDDDDDKDEVGDDEDDDDDFVRIFKKKVSGKGKKKKFKGKKKLKGKSKAAIKESDDDDHDDDDSDDASHAVSYTPHDVSVKVDDKKVEFEDDGVDDDGKDDKDDGVDDDGEDDKDDGPDDDGKDDKDDGLDDDGKDDKDDDDGESYGPPVVIHKPVAPEPHSATATTITISKGEEVDSDDDGADDDGKDDHDVGVDDDGEDGKDDGIDDDGEDDKDDGVDEDGEDDDGKDALDDDSGEYYSPPVVSDKPVAPESHSATAAIISTSKGEEVDSDDDGVDDDGEDDHDVGGDDHDDDGDVKSHTSYDKPPVKEAVEAEPSSAAVGYVSVDDDGADDVGGDD